MSSFVSREKSDSPERQAVRGSSQKNVQGASQASDVETIRAIREGDHKTYEILFKSYYQPLYEFAMSYVRSRAISEELIQDVFFDIWNRRQTWQPRCSLKAYLYRAVRNKSLDYLKHMRVVHRWEAQADSGTSIKLPGPEDTTRARELQCAIDQAISELPSRRRQVFILTRFHGLSYAEVASVLGISVNTVEVQVGRALKFLRSQLSAFLLVML